MPKKKGSGLLPLSRKVRASGAAALRARGGARGCETRSRRLARRHAADARRWRRLSLPTSTLPTGRCPRRVRSCAACACVACRAGAFAHSQDARFARAASHAQQGAPGAKLPLAPSSMAHKAAAAAAAAEAAPAAEAQR